MQIRFLLLVTGFILTISACNTVTEESATSEPVAVDYSPISCALGETIPERLALLDNSPGGGDEDVLVKNSDQVTTDLILGELDGTVVNKTPKAAEASGLNFPMILELSEIPSELRWGMIAFVYIELERLTI